MIALSLLSGNPNVAKASQSDTQEQVDGRHIVDKVRQVTGVKLPGEYGEIIRDYAKYSEIFDDQEICEYTVNFIRDKMKTNLGGTITEENKLLGIRCKIFVKLYNESPYDGEDGDNDRFEQLKRNIDFLDECGKDYQKGIDEISNRRIIEANKRIAEYDKMINQSNENIKEMTYRGLKNLVEFYEIWERNPDIVKEEEIQQSINYAKTVSDDCKEFGIDYKGERMKELKDKERLDAMLKLLKLDK